MIFPFESWQGLIIAIYIRVSTDDQVLGHSLEFQLSRLKQFAQQLNPKQLLIYIEEGKSARTTSRPEYQRMLHDIDQWSVLLVWKADRLHRKIGDSDDLVDHLKAEKKTVVSANEPFDVYTAKGRNLFLKAGLDADFYSDELGEKVTHGFEQKFVATSETVERYLWGYEKILTQRVRNGIRTGRMISQLKPVPKEQNMAQVLFNERLELGATYKDLSKMLNKAKFRGRSGALWTTRTVIQWMLNPKISGDRISNTSPRINTHPPLIEWEIWFRHVMQHYENIPESRRRKSLESKRFQRIAIAVALHGYDLAKELGWDE